MQSYPPRALDRRLQEDWAKDAREGPRVLMSLRSTKFRPLLFLSLYSSLSSSKLLSMASYGVASPLSLPSPFHCHSSSKKQRNPLMKKILGLQAPMELTSCDPLSCRKKNKREKKKEKKRVEEISQDEKEKIREDERRKILKELRKEKHAFYSSHNSCNSLCEELRDYYEGRHRSHHRPHTHRREKQRKPQEANINLPYFHGKDNVEANLDWEIRVEQQLKRKSTSKFYGSHSYPKKDQGQGILGVTLSKPKDEKGKIIEKQPLKASMQEKTSSMKCFKCLGRGHITSQCHTKKTMIMRGQDIYSSQDEATTSPSSSKSEKAKREESSEEIYPQEEGQPLMVKEECKEVSVSSKRFAKKERNFEIKTNIKEITPLRQPPHFLLCKKTLVSIPTPLRLEFIPQVKELLDEGLVRKSLNPCALLVPKIAPLIELVRNYILSWEDGQERGFQSLPYSNIPNITNTYVFILFTGVEERIHEFQEPLDLRSNPFQGGGNDAILPPRALDRRFQEDWAKDAREGPRVLMSLRAYKLQWSLHQHQQRQQSTTEAPPQPSLEELVRLITLQNIGWRRLLPLLLCLPLHLHGGKSPLKDLIEAQRSSLHRSSTSKLPSTCIFGNDLGNFVLIIL
ncbi:hypothetical protein HKD37_20G055783 [Glycine soja]